METQKITLPALHIIDGIRKLGGSAKITFPTPSKRIKKIERIQKVERSKSDPPYGERDPEYKTARLVYQYILGGDAHQVEVYRAYLTKATPEQQIEWGYQISYPAADPDFPRITWTFRIEDRDYAVLQDGATCPITGFEALVIIDQQHQPSTDGAFFGTETRVYERIPGPAMATTMTDQEGLEVTFLAQTVEPDTAPATGYLVLEDAISSINTRQAQRARRIATEFPPQPGQLYDAELDMLVPFVDQVKAIGEDLGDPDTEIDPMDYARARHRQFTVPTDFLNSYFRRFATYIDLPNIPDVLVSAQVIWETGGGDGEYEDDGNGAASGTSVNLSLSARGSANGSAVAMPEFLPKIISYNGRNIACEDYLFYVLGNVSHAAVLERLSDELGLPVQSWPAFRPETHTIVLQGQKVNVQAQSNAQCAVNISEENVSQVVSSGGGIDTDVGASIRTYVLPPTIHGAIEFTGDLTKSVAASATSVSVVVSGANFPGSSAVRSHSVSAQGSVTPTTLEATSPAEVPSTGLYLIDVIPRIYKWGYSFVIARVINAGNLTSS